MGQEETRQLHVVARMEDAVRMGYDAALAKLQGSDAAPSLKRFRQEHQEHIERLLEAEASTGARAQDSKVVEDYVKQVVDGTSKSLDYRGVFSTLRVAEAALRLETDSLLRAGPPPGLEDDLRRWVSEEEEHVDFLRLATAGLTQPRRTTKR